MSRLSVLHLPLLPCFSRYASASSASSTTASIATKKPPYTQGASINVFHFVYTILCLSRETAVSRRTRMRNRFMAHFSFLVSAGNGRHILPQTSTICCTGDSPEVRTRSFAALRMTYSLQAVTLSAAKGLARRTQRSFAALRMRGAVTLRCVLVGTVPTSPTMAPRGPCLSPSGRAGTGGQQVPGQKERRDRYGAQSCLLHTRQVFAQPRPGAGEACARGAPRSLQGRPCFR